MKFISIGVSTASGWYATLNDTRDKETGRLTKPGRIVFACLIASSILAMASQALDSYDTWDKGKKDADQKLTDARLEQERQRKADEDRLTEIKGLQSVQAAATAASVSSSTAAEKASSAVQGLGRITEAESAQLESSWRIRRPFGRWKASLEVKTIHPDLSEYPYLDQDHSLEDWTQRVLAYARKHDKGDWFLLDHGHASLDSDMEDLLRHEFVQSLVMSATVSFTIPSAEDSTHRKGALSLVLEASNVTIRVNINDEKTAIMSLDVDADMTCEQQAGSPALSNWVDLYGRQMTLYFGGVVAESDNLYFHLYYDDTADSRTLDFHCGKCETSPPLSLSPAKMGTEILTEKELGPFPTDYANLFPAKYDQIMRRMKQNAGLGTKPATN